MGEEIIRIEDIISMLMKRWKMIIFITLSLTIISAAVNFFIISPKYEASTKVFIGKEKNEINAEEQTYNYNDIEMYQKLLKTYAEVIQTNDLIEKAVDLESLRLKSQDILKNLKVIPRADTQILELNYIDKDKILCRDILDSITTEFIKSSKDLIPNGNIKIIESVRIPEKPVSPNEVINITITFFLGLIISMGLSCLLELMDNTFKNKEQMEKILSLPVLGVIPDVINY